MAETQPTICVIDDDPALQLVLELALREAGFNVVLASDGEEGIEQLAHMRPDAVVSDIMMPNMDGVEVFHQIKERLQDEGIPIIIMTALGRKPWFDDLEEEGAVFIQKPFDTLTLVQLLRDMII